MKLKNIIASISLVLSPSAFAEHQSLGITDYEVETTENYDYAEQYGYARCVDRKYESTTIVKRPGMPGGRRSKTEHFQASTQDNEFFVVERSVRLRNTKHVGSGNGCHDLRLIKKPGSAGITRITYKAHARLDVDDYPGIESCELTWRECTLN